ncbi:DUF2075 domain-containing protein [Candidatus Woesearchaeota archaeon]|nr:DUF2075 domain-containing protein [Candidatus Woesearchaeota archaeon]
MIIYESTKQDFLNDVEAGDINKKIEEKYLALIGRPHESMKRSWNNSMSFMYIALNDISIPQTSGVSIEFKIPYTTCKIDFLLSGKDKFQKNVLIIIELKQWQEVQKVEGQEAQVKTMMQGRQVQTNHPSYQAWSYSSLIEDYNESVQIKKIELYPCAYLHNYERKNPEPLVDSSYQYYVSKAPIFMKGDISKLRDFIKRYVKYGDNKETLYIIENGKIKPSKSLQDSLSNMLNGNPEFTLIDDQKVVYEKALSIARKSHSDGKKRVLIVEGGPGTGKTVIAMNLLVQLTNEDLVCQYVTKNSTPRNVYSFKLSGNLKKTRIDNLFKGSGSYVNSKNNEFGALIADEAHRLNEKSGMFKNKGENQIKEIIHAAKASIFFIDENQRVDIHDIGRVEEIQKFVKNEHAEVDVVKIESQFRCNGSDGYLAWLDDVLGIRETANFDGFDMRYDVRVIDDPEELRKFIEDKNKTNNKSRLVAGYCWNWIGESKNRPDMFDISIPGTNFKASWNLANTLTWAIDPRSIKEVGCIHTCQGLEFEYVGVIFGEDMRYEQGKIITDYTKRAKTDQSLKGIKRIAKENPDKANKIADEIIKNTYRTLMTRGQKGCYVYCCDKNLSRYIQERLNKFHTRDYN